MREEGEQGERLYQDNRTARERVLSMADATRQVQGPRKRNTTLGLMRLRYAVDPRLHGPLEPIADHEIFERAYGDQFGIDYWRAWIEAGDETDWPGILAVHAATDMASVHFKEEEIRPAWKNIRDSDVRSRLRCLANNPDVAHLVPDSLKIELGVTKRPRSPSTRPPAPSVERVAQFIVEAADGSKTLENIRADALQEFGNDRLPEKNIWRPAMKIAKERGANIRPPGKTAAAQRKKNDDA